MQTCSHWCCHSLLADTCCQWCRTVRWALVTTAASTPPDGSRSISDVLWLLPGRNPQPLTLSLWPHPLQPVKWGPGSAPLKCGHHGLRSWVCVGVLASECASLALSSPLSLVANAVPSHVLRSRPHHTPTSSGLAVSVGGGASLHLVAESSKCGHL